jgi:hypothetical protein
VSRVRIVIAVPQALAEAISALLRSHRELQVVDQVSDAPGLFRALHRVLSSRPQSPDDPIVAITASGEPGEEEPVRARLLDEFPGLIVYDIQVAATWRYRTCIEVQELSRSLDGLLADLHKLLAGSSQSANMVRISSRELDR